MKSFRKPSRKIVFFACAAVCGAVCVVYAAAAAGTLPSWIRNIEARTALESVLFRAMGLPGGDVLHRRPPRETRVALAELIQKQPKEANLYSLRALEDEFAPVQKGLRTTEQGCTVRHIQRLLHQGHGSRRRWGNLTIERWQFTSRLPGWRKLLCEVKWIAF